MRTATPISTCFLDHAAHRIVGDRAIDLDPAVHRPGMHDDRIRLGVGQLLRIQSVEPEKTPWHSAPARATYARVAARSIITTSAPARPAAMSWNTLTPKAEISAGISVGGPTTRTWHPIVVNRWMFDRANAGMRDVAADRHRQPADPSLPPLDGQRIQQRLGRMLVGPVAGIDHRRVDDLRQQVRRPRLVMAHHQQIAVHRVQRRRGVDQRLALVHRGTWRRPC